MTPNLNLLYSYKSVSVGFGIGMDWINKDSEEVQHWIYNSHIFYAIGFGINIFKSSADDKTTKSSAE